MTKDQYLSVEEFIKKYQDKFIKLENSNKVMYIAKVVLEDNGLDIGFHLLGDNGLAPLRVGRHKLEENGTVREFFCTIPEDEQQVLRVLYL